MAFTADDLATLADHGITIDESETLKAAIHLHDERGELYVKRFSPNPNVETTIGMAQYLRSAPPARRRPS